jgi:hypothetical protein
MTIRDRLRQQLTRLSLIVGMCGVGIAVGLVHWPPVFWLLAVFLFPVLAGTTIVVGMRFVQCPRCRVRLGATARAAVRERSSADSCAHCGVNLDEPMESPDNAK